MNDSVKVLVVDEDQLVQAMVRRLFKTVVLICLLYTSDAADE